MPTRKKGDDEKEGIGFDLGLGGLFKGITNLIEAANRLAEKGEEVGKTGEIDFGDLGKLKGLKDLKAVYGINVRTMADGRPAVQQFGNVKRTPKGPVVEEFREPLVDVFDTPDGMQIVVEMPGIEETDIRLEVRGDILTIRAEGEKRKYHKEVLLPREAAKDSLTSAYKNGVLEIRIRPSEGAV